MKKLNLLSYLKKYWWAYTVVLIALSIGIALDMYYPLVYKKIVDEVLVGGKIYLLSSCLLSILAVGVGRFIFNYVKEFTCDMIGSKIGCDLRIELFDKIQSLSANFFDKINTGELMARITEDAGKVWDMFSFIGMLLVQTVFHSALALFCMYRLNWRLAIIPTICMGFAALIALKMENELGSGFEAIAECGAELNNTAQENLAGIRTVKSFAREEFEKKKFFAHTEKFRDLNISQSKVFVKYNPLIQCITHILPYLVLVPGGLMVMTGYGDLTVGDLTAFISYASNIVWPMEMLGWLTNGFSQGLASIKRLNLIFAEETQIKNEGEVVQLDKVQGKIQFDHVSFAKENGEKILDDISFCVEKGKTLGIMGATGSGKTTITNLLKRIYDCTEGEIRLDDVDIKKIPLWQLRENISSVMQDIFLFSDSIDGNVRLGDKDNLTEEVVDASIELSASDEFVFNLNEKLNTIIGERGVGLSGGQKQRLTIARALCRNKPVLILDDSTSALDTETEQKIQSMLRSLEGMTKIIIAHRISAVKKADEILVLENGKIAEHGNHETLLEQKGLYYETYCTQYAKQ